MKAPKTIWAAPFLCAFAASAWAQQPPAANAAPSADEQQVRQGVVAFVEAFNSHKADALAALFHPDARMTLRDGTQFDGRDEIKKSFEAAFAETPKCAISVVVDSLRFLTPDVAVGEGCTCTCQAAEPLTSKRRSTVVH